MKTEKTYFWDSYLRGIGQIMLQGSTWTGLLFFIGILINSPLMAFSCLLAVVVATVTAKLLKYDPEHIENGLYGFNAALVGVGMIAFFKPILITWIAIIVLSALSSIIMNFCLNKKIPVFTFPFILLTWIALYVFHNLIPIEAGSPPIDVNDLLDPRFALLGHGLGFGEVIFQSSIISGVIFFAAVYINSPTAALYGLFGAILGMVLAVIFKERAEDVKMGMFSFNAVLCAIVFSGTKKKDVLYVALAVVLSTITEDLMLKWGLSVLTFPFVFATWLTLITRDILVKKIVKTTND